MLYALVSFFLPLGVYLIYICPTITGGDSAELITAAYILGVPHAPGYPLYTMLGKLFTFIPLFSIAWRVNLLSAVLDASCCLLIYLSLKCLLKNPISALCGSLSLAFSRYFWHYSEVAEVFALNNFFLALLIYILILWRQQYLSKDYFFSPKYLYWMAFIYGISLTNQHTIILLIPAFLFYIFYLQKNLIFQWKKLLLGALLFLLGLFPYLYLPLAALRQPALNWDNPVNLQNFKAAVLREDYGGISGILKEAKTKFKVYGFIQLRDYFTSFYRQFAPSGLLLGILGLLGTFF